MKRLGLALLAVVVTSTVSFADTQVDRSVELTGNSVSIEMISGKLTIEGTGDSNVVIKGVLRSDCEKLDVTSSKSGVKVEVDWTCSGNRRSYSADSELTVSLPRRAKLGVEVVSTDVSVTGMEGDVKGETISGTLEVRGDSKSLDLSSVSGRIALSGSSPLENLDLETVSGTIEAEVDPGSDASLDLQTVSGHITIRLPQSASADFDVTSFSGSISNDLGPAAKKTSDVLPSSELKFSLGGGGARIRIESLSGRIEIRKR